VTAVRPALGTVLVWRIGWLTASRWSVKTRIAARIMSNLLPAPVADPFIAIAVIILIAAMAAARIARPHRHSQTLRPLRPGGTPSRPDLTVHAPTGRMRMRANPANSY